MISFRIPLVACLVFVTSCSSPGERVTWSNGDVSLVGTLVLPAGDGPHPLVVFIQGSGCVERDNRRNRAHSARLAEMGVASFVYDKRGCGESGGDWKKAGLDPLAEDLVAAIDQLADDPRIDPERIGLMGLSQGAWVSLIAATRSEHVSQVIWLSGPPMTPARQGVAITRMHLEREGWSAEEIARAIALEEMTLEVYRHDRGWDEGRATIEAARSAPWFEAAGIDLQPRESWNWRWYSSFFDHDPVPALRNLATPVLAIYGAEDRIVPVAESIAIIDGLAAAAPARRTTVMLDGVGHELGARDRAWPSLYWSTLADWWRSTGFLEPPADP